MSQVKLTIVYYSATGISTTADPKQPAVAAEVLEAVRYMTQRVIRVTGWLLKGQANDASK
ncbi:MAG: hypothetical protein JXA21_11895 [Anaerolineae bacterium]|nr:hypothetical protein [Anaerolineae bacterium]